MSGGSLAAGACSPRQALASACLASAGGATVDMDT